jgi:hypothetical protein
LSNFAAKGSDAGADLQPTACVRINGEAGADRIASAGTLATAPSAARRVFRFSAGIAPPPAETLADPIWIPEEGDAVNTHNEL